MAMPSPLRPAARAKPCDVLPLADDVRVLVIDAGFSTLPPNKAVKRVAEVECDTIREMVDETDATVILVCGAPPHIKRENQGIDVTFPFCWYKIPYTLMDNNENKEILFLEIVFDT
jgi:hypothetical protein